MTGIGLSRYHQFRRPRDTMELTDELQTLWVLYVLLQRSALLGQYFSAPTQIPSQNRVLQIPSEYYNLLIAYGFDERFARQFQNYFTNRINIEANLVNAMINQDQNSINYYAQEYQRNSDTLAELLGQYPYWDVSRWKELLNKDLRLFMDEIMAVLLGDYEKEIMIFEQIIRNSMEIGRYMSSGFVRGAI